VDRRNFIGLTGSAAAAAVLTPALASAEDAAPDAAPGTARIEAALARLSNTMPGRISYQLKVSGERRWSAEARPQDILFTGSAFKTFVLATFLRGVEAGRIDMDEQLEINDDVRSIGAPVFMNMTGTTTARSVLLAMMAESDNTATDAAMKRVGVENVRNFLAKAEMTDAQIPGSTRLFVSYCAGAPYGVDVGWSGMEQILQGHFFGPLRSPANNRETTKCSAAQMVSFFERSLAGDFFKQDSTLNEYKHQLTLAHHIVDAVPPDTLAYVKNGWGDWNGYHGLCFPGQIDLGANRATFCFTWGWKGEDGRAQKLNDHFYAQVREILTETKAAFG
jgi:beta-lactamase class A